MSEKLYYKEEFEGVEVLREHKPADKEEEMTNEVNWTVISTVYSALTEKTKTAQRIAETEEEVAERLEKLELMKQHLARQEAAVERLLTTLTPEEREAWETRPSK